MLCVFLLPAFTRPGNECQDLLSPWDGTGPRFILSFERVRVRTHVNFKGKSPPLQAQRRVKPETLTGVCFLPRCIFRCSCICCRYFLWCCGCPCCCCCCYCCGRFLFLFCFVCLFVLFVCLFACFVLFCFFALHNSVEVAF